MFFVLLKDDRFPIMFYNSHGNSATGTTTIILQDPIYYFMTKPGSGKYWTWTCVFNCCSLLAHYYMYVRVKKENNVLFEDLRNKIRNRKTRDRPVWVVSSMKKSLSCTNNLHEKVKNFWHR